MAAGWSAVSTKRFFTTGKAGTYPDPVKRGFSVEDRMKMHGRYNRPVSKGDLRSVILDCRRPELYKRRDVSP